MEAELLAPRAESSFPGARGVRSSPRSGAHGRRAGRPRPEQLGTGRALQRLQRARRLAEKPRRQKSHIVPDRPELVAAGVEPDVVAPKRLDVRVTVHDLPETVEVAPETLLQNAYHQNPPQIHPRAARVPAAPRKDCSAMTFRMPKSSEDSETAAESEGILPHSGNIRKRKSNLIY